MAQMPWQTGDGGSWPAHAQGGNEPVTEVTGRRISHRAGADDGLRAPAPAAHSTWGPEFWPAAVRANVKVWPPVFRERQLVAAVRRPILGPHRIAFVSNKDGVGKTTTARILHTIFQTTRVDECALVDANTDAERAATIEPEKGRAGGIIERVDGDIFSPAADSDYAGLMHLLTDAYPIVLCDVGTGVGESATRQILDNCDQIVVVATPAVDGLYAASSCLDDLRAAGYAHLVDGAICAINRIRPMPFSDLLNIDRHFQRRCREVVRIPWDTRASAANATDLDELRSTTRTAFFELAAAIARTFGDPTITQPREDEEVEEETP